MVDLLWPLSVDMHVPAAGSQILTVLSRDADASRTPLRDQAIAFTDPLWPMSVDTHVPVAGSQILTVSSTDPEASRVASRAASCDQATELTQPLWPSSVNTHVPAAGSQILTVMSRDAEASHVVSCDQVTDMTESLWPSSVCRHALQLSVVFGNRITHSGSSLLNWFFVMLLAGLNTSADAYTWRGLFSTPHLWYRINRVASLDSVDESRSLFPCLVKHSSF